MAHIPEAVLKRQPLIPGLKLRNRGKVRDSYDLPDHPDKMLVVVSDRCSAFDFNLNALIDKKGEVLNALSCFCTATILNPICETDLVAFGSAIDQYLPKQLRGDADLQKRATNVMILPEPDVEDIVRFNLTGSGWTSYQETGMVCGHALPSGLKDGNLLPKPIYTPTTKAKIGHDEHITAESVRARYGDGREALALKAATAVRDYAAERGIILADTKFEISALPDGRFVVADEKATPDSSRYWHKVAWVLAQAKGKLPPSLDKQFVRLVCIALGINKLDPKNPAHLATVDALEIPRDVICKTTQLYRYIFWRLTGMKLETYQRTRMGIDIPEPRRAIEIIVGSESDMPQLEKGLKTLENYNVGYKVHVMSCHRNPVELYDYLECSSSVPNVFIGAAGKLAALPGMIKSYLCAHGLPDVTVIGVGLRGETERADQAARRSMDELPGQPVELDPEGEAYFGEDGFDAACIAAVKHEFMPRNVETKPVRMNIRTFVPI